MDHNSSKLNTFDTHIYLSISSLAGSYTMKLKMGTGAKILLNAVIGGTTEMIGGSLRQMHITHFNHLFC